MKDKQLHKASQIIFSPITESQEGFSAKEKKMSHLEVSSSWPANKVSLATLFKTFLHPVVPVFITGPCVASALKELIIQAASTSLFNNN